MSSDLRDADKVDDPLLANPVTTQQPAHKGVVSLIRSPCYTTVNCYLITPAMCLLSQPGRKETQSSSGHLHLDRSLIECGESLLNYEAVTYIRKLTPTCPSLITLSLDSIQQSYSCEFVRWSISLT